MAKSALLPGSCPKRHPLIRLRRCFERKFFLRFLATVCVSFACDLCALVNPPSIACLDHLQVDGLIDITQSQGFFVKVPRAHRQSKNRIKTRTTPLQDRNVTKQF